MIWAASADAQAEIGDAKYWMRKHPTATAESRAWAHDARFIDTTTAAEGGFVSDGRIRCGVLARPADPPDAPT